MRSALPLLVLAASLLCAPVAMALSEYGIEGMGVVSTRANEGRATLSPDGTRIVFASDRPGGAGGLDLWQATLRDGRWQDAVPLALNGPGDERDPYITRDGRWLLFASDRPPSRVRSTKAAGRSGDVPLALYRAAIAADGTVGAVEPLTDVDGSHVTGRGPALSMDGGRLLFARHAGNGRGFDLFVAPMVQGMAGVAEPLQALNSEDDEIDGDWLGDGGAIVFSRAKGGQSRLWSSACAWTAAALQPVDISFNTAEGQTSGGVIDNARPGELLLSSNSVRAPRAGGSDVYRLRAPQVAGASCGAR